MNAESELRFPVQFGSGEREVFLKGEAYFDVQKDTSRRFVVHLKESNVTVLGTSFNIKAYGDEDYIYTTLVEGKVCFTSVLLQSYPVCLANGRARLLLWLF